MKIATSVKKTAALFLSTAVMSVALPISGIVTSATSEFDESDITMRVGIISDLHLSYSADSMTSIKNKIDNYSDTVAALSSMSGNNLDAVLLCGDYTSTGGAVQGETFASASKAIMDAINAGKPENEKTKFIMAYGNHDTEWNGAMDYAQWESMLDGYGLLDGITNGPEGSGSYSATTVRDGKTYHFFSVETETYNNPSNTFRTDVLEWLDNGIAAASPDSYVYVISHAPIKESKVYGADIDFEKNADWATAEAGYTGSVTHGNETYSTSSDIDSVLRKYPNVMYFSGHTHLTNALESTIMSEDYTAVEVAALNCGDLFSNVNGYLDGDNASINPKPGYALYLEVDANGNQRINRIADPYSFADTTVIYSEERNNVPNSSTAQGEPQTINGVVVGSVTINSTNAVTTNLQPWVMSAPNAGKSHLVKYSAAARRSTPVFSNDAAVEITEAYLDGSSLKADISFSAAACTANIIRYDIDLLNSNDELCDKQRVLGNWTPNSTGVKAGTNHKDATEFKYNSVVFKNAGNAVGCSVRVTAIDEFGGTASITSAPISQQPISVLNKPVKRMVYEQMFGATVESSVASSNQSGVTFSTDENGKLVTVIDATEDYRNAVFMTSQSKYNSIVTNRETNSPFNNWAYPGVNPQNLTDFTPNDTFVYEADFAASENGGNVYLHLRAPDMRIGTTSDNENNTVAEWQTDYTGIILNSGGVHIGICNTNKFLSDKFKLNDTNTHHLTVVSSPKLISVWIDDVEICSNYPFNPNAWDGTNMEGRFLSEKMTPTMAIHVTQGRTITVSNQELYYYYSSDEASKYVKPDVAYDANMFNSMTLDRAFPLSHADLVTNTIDERGVITTTANISGSSQAWTNLCYVTSAKYFAEKGEGIYKVWASPGSKNSKYFTDLNSDDTYIYEADFKRTSNNGEIYFHVRTPDLNFSNGIAGYQTDYTGVHITSQEVKLDVAQQTLNTSNAFRLNDNNLHHIVIISSPDDISVTIDGISVFANEPFNKEAMVEKGIPAEAFDTSEMIPTMAVYILNVNLELSNQVLAKCHDLTPYTNTNQNLVTSENGELYSGFAKLSGSYTVDNSIYADTRYTNIPTAPWTQDRYSLFGDNNAKFVPDNKSSYLLSGLATAENSSIKDNVSGNTYPSRMTVYLGQYNNEEAFAFIQDNALNFYIGGSRKINIDLSQKYGYSVGDTVRITVLLTPFGFKYHLNGEEAFEYSFENPNLINYTGLSLGIGGTVGAWRDIVMYENTDNGVEYAEKLTKSAEKVIRTRGVYFTEEDYQVSNGILTACNEFEGTSNNALIQYVGLAENIISNAEVVNNMVLEGLTSIPADKDFDFVETFNHYGIQLFENGACPISLNDTWQIDFDLDIYSIGNSDVRMIFAPYSNNGNIILSKGGVMIQNNAFFGIENPTGSGISYKSIGSGSKSIKAADTSWHFRYIITPAVGGSVSVRNIVTSKDGQEVFFDYTFSDTNVTELNPYLYYRTANIGIKNLCISYDLTNDFAALESACTKEDTSDIALVCANRYNNAYAAGSDILENRNRYGRNAIRTATTELINSINGFEKNGDVNLDKLTDLRDLIRLKKIILGLADETVTADMNASGDILSEDLVLLQKYLLGK